MRGASKPAPFGSIRVCSPSALSFLCNQNKVSLFGCSLKVNLLFYIAMALYAPPACVLMKGPNKWFSLINSSYFEFNSLNWPYRTFVFFLQTNQIGKRAEEFIMENRLFWNCPCKLRLLRINGWWYACKTFFFSSFYIWPKK